MLADQERASYRGSDQRLSASEQRSLSLSFLMEAVQKIGPSVVCIDTEMHMLDDKILTSLTLDSSYKIRADARSNAQICFLS